MVQLLVSYLLIFTVALMIVAFGGMFAERSGVINLGLEGTMVVSGFIGLMVLSAMNKAGAHPALVVVVTLIVAVVMQLILVMCASMTLMNRYRHEKTFTYDREEAMSIALRHTLSAITSSTFIIPPHSSEYPV
jgi:simple sugar transport system permease protein